VLLEKMGHVTIVNEIWLGFEKLLKLEE
jgi:hypothetical protein